MLIRLILLMTMFCGFAHCTEALPAEAAPEKSTVENIDQFFIDYIVSPVESVLFYSLVFNEGTDDQVKLPIIVIILALGGIFFTLRYGFMNIKLFKHAIQCVRGKYDNPDDPGEVSHFKALTSALSATVGLGNISGVAVAIFTGGAGAVFWMWFIAFFGMSMKASSCAFAQLYRKTTERGKILGGPMVYLEQGLAENGKAGLGKGFGIFYAVCCVFGAIGAGNMFQANQTYTQIQTVVVEKGSETPGYLPWIVGIGLSLLVGSVIIGGIKRIGSVTSKMVPAMCLIYSIICLIIIFTNIGEVPAMLGSIFSEAFTGASVAGGILGALVAGMQRAVFSNEAGLGSAAIAHAAAKTEEPVREGVVAMLGPFIDTIVVCTMTALAILITGAHESGAQGIAITSTAFSSIGDFAPILLTIMAIIFAYSTIISWGYYGERAIEYLFGAKGIMPYRIIYVLIIITGPVLSLGSILRFSDAMLFAMAFPNIIGMVMLSGKMKGLIQDYTTRLSAGEMKTYK